MYPLKFEDILRPMIWGGRGEFAGEACRSSLCR